MLFLGLVERARPAIPEQTGIFRNLGIGGFGFAAQVIGSAWLAPITSFTVNRAHGGLFLLPAGGAGLILGIAIYVVAMDMGEYLFHRAQHAIPFLWAMHSLHHSDESFGTTTTVRHFWLESWIKSLTVWLAIGMLFKASPVIVVSYGLLATYNFVSHANLRLDFGPAWWLLNSPAYHRLHHSPAPEHAGCNYAALLPIFDLLSGAHFRPPAGLFPDTGLATGATPRSAFQALAWPLLRGN